MLLARAVIFGAFLAGSIAALLAIIVTRSNDDFARVRPFYDSRCVIFNKTLEKNAELQTRIRFDVLFKVAEQDIGDFDLNLVVINSKNKSEELHNPNGTAIAYFDENAKFTKEKKDKLSNRYMLWFEDHDADYSCYYKHQDIVRSVCRSNETYCRCVPNDHINKPLCDWNTTVARNNCFRLKEDNDTAVCYGLENYVVMKLHINWSFVLVPFFAVVAIISMAGLGLSLYLDEKSVLTMLEICGFRF